MKLLKFSATWCGPCKVQAKMLEEHPIVVEVEEIDVDSDNELIPKFNIRSVPTMILIDDEGNALHRWTGITESAEINRLINDFRNTKSA